MNINKMPKEELEKMSHLDIAYNIIKSGKTTLTTVDLLKKLCSLLEYDDGAFETLVGDFYTSLNLDKRFILIDGKWDLSEKHVVNVVVEDELDEYEDELEEEDNIDDEEEVEMTEDEAVLDDAEALEDVEDDLDDDMEDLTILDEDELDDEENE